MFHFTLFVMDTQSAAGQYIKSFALYHSKLPSADFDNLDSSAFVCEDDPEIKQRDHYPWVRGTLDGEGER